MTDTAETIYVVHRCRSCGAQVFWEPRDRFTFGWYHGAPGEGCVYGQYLNRDHVERIETVIRQKGNDGLA